MSNVTPLGDAGRRVTDLPQNNDGTAGTASLPRSPRLSDTSNNQQTNENNSPNTNNQFQFSENSTEATKRSILLPSNSSPQRAHDTLASTLFASRLPPDSPVRPPDGNLPMLSATQSEVSNRVLSGKSFVPACKYILTRWYVCLFVCLFVYLFICLFVCPSRLLFFF